MEPSPLFDSIAFEHRLTQHLETIIPGDRDRAFDRSGVLSLSASIFGVTDFYRTLDLCVSIQYQLLHKMALWVVDRSGCLIAGVILQPGNQHLARGKHGELRREKGRWRTLQLDRRSTCPVGREIVDDLAGPAYVSHDHTAIGPHPILVDHSARGIKTRFYDAIVRQPKKGAHHSRTSLDQLHV